MPFTFSHPAAILPLLNKRWKMLSASGLVIGSMAPDFESFIKLGGGKIYSHTWVGVFWFDLPLALGLTFLFHLVIKKPLIDHLPSYVGERLETVRQSNWLRYFRDNIAIVLLSLLIGIVSHLLWDAATHLNLLYPDDVSSKLKLAGKRVYILLQYSFSIIGIIYMILYFIRLPRLNGAKSNSEKGPFWIYILMIAALINSCVTTFAHSGNKVRFDYIDLVNLSISGLFYGLIIMSLVSNISNYKHQKISVK